MRRTLMAVLCALALSMSGVACGGDSGGSPASSDTDGSGGGIAQEDNSVDNSTPELEGEGTEEAPDGTGTKAVSVKLPGLPVGGNSNVESATLQCVDVGWTPQPDLPDGIEIKITGISLDPSDGFKVTTESCPGDVPACMSDDFRLTSSSRCSVAVAWGESGFENGGTLAVTAGEVICKPGQVEQCESFRTELESDKDQIAKATIPLEPPDQVTTDNGSPDNANPDNANPETGSPDTGSPDTGSPDNGSPDNGSGG